MKRTRAVASPVKVARRAQEIINLTDSIEEFDVRIQLQMLSGSSSLVLKCGAAKHQPALDKLVRFDWARLYEEVYHSLTNKNEGQALERMCAYIRYILMRISTNTVKTDDPPSPPMYID